jgi:hypothetical protein
MATSATICHVAAQGGQEGRAGGIGPRAASIGPRAASIGVRAGGVGETVVTQAHLQQVVLHHVVYVM